MIRDYVVEHSDRGFSARKALEHRWFRKFPDHQPEFIDAEEISLYEVAKGTELPCEDDVKCWRPGPVEENLPMD